MPSQKRTGELAVLCKAVLGSVFPILTVVTVSILSPLFSAALCTGFAAVFFATTLTWRNHWKQDLTNEAWKNMLLATFFIGIVFYALVFTGYRFTSPGNGAMVGLMEVFFTFIIVNLLWKHERFVPMHAFGAFLMILGALSILLPRHTGTWNIGNLLILLATASAPIGNIYAQRARALVSADMMMFVRSAISSAFLLVLAWIFEITPTSEALADSFWYLVLSGIFLLGFCKILWLEAIHRLPIAKTVALAEINVPLTLLFAYLFLGQGMTQEQTMSIVPMLAGVYFLTKK